MTSADGPDQPTRRRTIELAVGAAAATVAGSTAAAQRSPDPHTKVEFDAIVVGAGLSGLNAARQLQARGFSVQVIEGRDRIGGRAYSVRVPDGPTVDLGGQWISDAHTRALKLADEAGISYHPTYLEGDAIHVDGSGADRVRYDYLPVGLVGKLDMARSFGRIDRLSKHIDHISIEEFDGRSLREFVEEVSWSKKTRDVTDHILARDLCVRTDSVSVYELIEQVATLGGTENAFAAEQYIVTNGAGQFADYLAAQLRHPVVLGETVSAVRQAEDRVVVYGNSRTYTAKRVVVAIPPQLLPTISFEPALPQQRAAVFKGFVNGVVIKTSAVFEEPWWRARGLSGWMSGRGQPFPVVADSSPHETKFGILTALTSTEDTVPLRGLSEPGRCQAFLSWLERIVGGPIPEPIATYSIDWNEEPLSRGGYASRRGIGGWSASEDVFAPFGQVHFAGTETSSIWRSYLEGALAAGERAADEIIAARSM